jgi:hypothetical protein
MLIEYSPHATAYAARCKPDTLRDWRRLGFFKGLGERKGKGHLFTLSDVARIVIASFIARNGASLREAFEIVGARGWIIDALVARERNAPGGGNSAPPARQVREGVEMFAQDSWANEHYFSFVVNPDCSFPESVTGAPISNIQFDVEPMAVLQVNVSKLIRSALERLDTYETHAAES